MNVSWRITDNDPTGTNGSTEYRLVVTADVRLSRLIADPACLGADLQKKADIWVNHIVSQLINS